MTRRRRQPNTCDQCRRRVQWVTLVNRGEGRPERKRVPVDVAPHVDPAGKRMAVRYSHNAAEWVGRWLTRNEEPDDREGWRLASLHLSTCPARRRTRSPARDVRPPEPVPPRQEPEQQLALDLPAEEPTRG